ncbi:MAG TPA: aminopeptidase N [Geothermobacteraceae bacterium]|nr:aminopeptidase N [Geothermobacteraceae bacterium]
MITTNPTIYLHDYQPPAYLVDTLVLEFDLAAEATLVTATASYRSNPNGPDEPFSLRGADLELLQIELDGQPLEPSAYQLNDASLTISQVPDNFQLRTVVRINPAANTALEGLYLSSGNFCTQCEAEGFRKITFYPDRPDVMARFTTTIRADRVQFPILLSNGNPVARGELDNGRHFVTWEDPYPKPSYLFALVAGDLAEISASYTTGSGREIALRFYVEHRNQTKVDHALKSLQKAMRWDEERFGLEYDLDIYMVVAVDDFNMGAMENKGLNVFNSKYVLALPETATDADYQGIEGVIGHEYFHNWTGNRITCRDWFQLSLKEGLTVFRDQEFSADMGSRAVKRIEEVRLLRNFQFPEDAGPMAHPVRPASYQEINNFYTTTVYNKGAELIRMYHTLLGVEGFRKGMNLYFERHDGQAVTTDDFLSAMAGANGVDLTQFSRWYSQAGTPTVKVTDDYDAANQSYTLRFSQSCPATPDGVEKLPFHLPIKLGLIDREGEELPLQLEGEVAPGTTSRVIALREHDSTIRFTGIPGRPIPSLLRDFSAPVVLDYPYLDDELAFLMARDSDPFNRWEAGQKLYTRILLQLVEKLQQERPLQLPELVLTAFGQTLTDQRADPALISLALTLPAETYLAEQMEVADPTAIHAAHQFMRRELAAASKTSLFEVYRRNCSSQPYTPDAADSGRRSLKNLALAYLMTLPDPGVATLCFQQFQHADNMTDTLAALVALANSKAESRETALAAFYQHWQNDPLVLDKWLTLQATAARPDTLEQVKQLLKHPAFNLKNPNKVRALIGAFASGNPAAFHAEDGSGYAFIADRVLELDRLNPQIAARLVSSFNRWRKFDANRQELIIMQLQRIAGTAKLSANVREIVEKCLPTASLA